ncbi:MAG: YdbL family protein [Alphaproteobacteria bacterium]
MFALLPAAGAQSQARLLDAPRAAGTVGERYDGYAVVRGTPTPGISSLVDQVNADRRALYTQRAAADGVPVEAIGKIYAAEIIKSAPKGTWFLSESGQWTQK